MTREEKVYADFLNILGSDPDEPPAVEEILVRLHDAATTEHGEGWKAADRG